MSDWIALHIVPFRTVAFVAAQQMIEETRLPERCLLVGAQRHGYCAFQAGNPRRQNEINSAANEKMDVRSA